MDDEVPGGRDAHGEGLRTLPALTLEELDVLYQTLDATLGRLDAAGAPRMRLWSILNSLRTAVGETLNFRPWPSFTCPRCGASTANPNDIREGYCGRCHDWTGVSSVTLSPLAVERERRTMDE